MKRMNLILILSLFTALLKAPESLTIEILAPEAVNYYSPLIKVLVHQESSWIQTAYNKKEIACSWFQIRPCRVRDFNERTGKHYTMADTYIYYRAEEIFLYYTKGRSYEQVARGWAGGDAGTKKATNSYWQKMKVSL